MLLSKDIIGLVFVCAVCYLNVQKKILVGIQSQFYARWNKWKIGLLKRYPCSDGKNSGSPLKASQVVRNWL